VILPSCTVTTMQAGKRNRPLGPAPQVMCCSMKPVSVLSRRTSS
jgi:hypothetical protein